MRHRGRVGEIALGFPGTEAGVVPGKMELLSQRSVGRESTLDPEERVRNNGLVSAQRPAIFAPE